MKYYIDSQNGNDKNLGVDPLNAWRSLKKVNATTFRPGDFICFSAGMRWKGHLHPKGSGTKNSPITICAYGKGAKPMIEGEGKVKVVLKLHNQEYWDITELVITNLGPSEQKGRTGILIVGENIGILNHLHLKNLEIHDVNGDSKQKDVGNGGIFFCVKGSRKPTRFHDLLIEGCHVLNVNRTAISVGDTSWRKKYSGYGGQYPTEIIDTFSHTSVVIRNNHVSEIGGDGIVCMFSDHPLVECNTATKTSLTSIGVEYPSAAIWPWRCEHALFQYNIASETKFNQDGHAWDCDFNNNTVYQYNLSYNNEGGWMLFCLRESNNSIVHHNISWNDRYIFDPLNGSTADVYQNVFLIIPTEDFGITRRGLSSIKAIDNFFVNLGKSFSPNWGDDCIEYVRNFYSGFDNVPAEGITKNIKQSKIIASLQPGDWEGLAGRVLSTPYNRDAKKSFIRILINGLIQTLME